MNEEPITDLLFTLGEAIELKRAMERFMGFVRSAHRIGDVSIPADECVRLRDWAEAERLRVREAIEKRVRG